MSPKDAYRIIWLDYINKPSKYLEQIMDELQPYICYEEWNDFTLSLPGYIEFWNKSAYTMLDKIRQTFLN